ncbi:helix-turn-helix domain-containing protein [Blautia massiliensis (ex Durand et al. 2017)]|uniref:helix-turn-helix domain-containing protein n=1 Tax=Blautia massiliensis (ex Durand et al. 2017) TaxID=1737424 RepID=UPI003B51ACED
MNRAVKIRIYPNKEQRVQIEQTIGCSRFIYNQMLADKISYYQKEKKMLRNTPAGYKDFHVINQRSMQEIHIRPMH